MARSSSPPLSDGAIVDIDVTEEMRNAFLEYSYSVIHARALPDARDGLKPVHRRILFGMHELGLRPDKGHVKSSRVVGEVMGKYHPHGDQAIYDALVRLAQPFSMRLPLVDGHGNFGSLDDGPAASRYTEARMSPAALLLVGGLDEDTVDYVPNYDDSLQQPAVLPVAYPNLLVNGTTGIAVGMATSMPPHNLGEVIAATRHLISNPDASLENLMRFVPGPDLPGGGRIVGLEGIHQAYATGRGTFRTRATVSIEKLTARRSGIVVTQLPYLIGPEKVIEKIKEGVNAKRIQGIADVKDLSDRSHGLRLVIEVKNGFHPEAVLEQLFRLTPMEDSFGINNVALVDGQPLTLGLKQLLQVYVEFRTQVVRRRTEFRLAKRKERLHLVAGLLIAILDIDEVIQLIRSSEHAAMARDRLRQVFDLSQAQADYILELQLRRLTKFSRLELEKEQADLAEQIAALQRLLEHDEALLALVSDELALVAKQHGTARRTVLLEAAGTAAPGAVASLEVADDPVFVLLSSTGLLARTGDQTPLATAGDRVPHDAITGCVATSARGEFGVLTSAGRILRLPVVDLPALAPSAAAPSLAGGSPVTAFVDLAANEQVITVVPIGVGLPGLALGTASGIVKRVVPDYPNRPDWEVISLKDGDQVVGGSVLYQDVQLVFVTSDAQLLHFPASLVRPQGRGGGGIAGIRLASGASVVFFGATLLDAQVVTVAGSRNQLLPGAGNAVKVTALCDFPSKGRATAGVRCQRFRKGEDVLTFAWAGSPDARAAQADGAPVTLPRELDKRDAAGSPSSIAIAAIGQLPSLALRTDALPAAASAHPQG